MDYSWGAGSMGFVTQLPFSSSNLIDILMI